MTDKELQDKINYMVRSNPAVVQSYDELSMSLEGIPKLNADIEQLCKDYARGVAYKYTDYLHENGYIDSDYYTEEHPYKSFTERLGE